MILLLSLLIMTLTGAIGALMLKLISLQKSTSKKIIILCTGGVFYIISAIINIMTLKSYDYSIVYPATAIAYIWTMFLGKVVLQESITTNKIIGCVLLIIGTVLLTQ